MRDKSVSRRGFLVSGLMVGAAGTTYLVTPRASAAVSAPNLELIIPKSFSGWVSVESQAPVLPDPNLQRTVNQIYDETLARTYVEPRTGRAVMLVIAYGAKQTDSLQAHQPEVCYGAQGFVVERSGDAAISGAFGTLPAKLVYAFQGARTEPIVYWLAVGERITNFGLRQKFRQLQDGIRGKIPEGFLVRASLIGPDEPESYSVLEEFLSGLVSSLPPSSRRRIAGV